MTEADLEESIRRAAVDEKVTCEAMLALARRAGEFPQRIGALCDRMGLKITACQLGCFR